MKIPLIISTSSHLLLVVLIMIISNKPYQEVKQKPALDVSWVTLVTPPGKVTETIVEPFTPPQPAGIKINPKVAKEAKVAKSAEKKIELPEPEEPQQKEVGQPGIPGAPNITVDNPNFKFIYYLNLIRYRIQENWRPPTSARSLDLKAMVRFKVDRYGRITQIVLEQSSGNLLFDQSVQRAVQVINRFPPLPEEFEEDELVIHLEFEGIQ